MHFPWPARRRSICLRLSPSKLDVGCESNGDRSPPVARSPLPHGPGVTHGPTLPPLPPSRAWSIGVCRDPPPIQRFRWQPGCGPFKSAESSFVTGRPSGVRLVGKLGCCLRRFNSSPLSGVRRTLCLLKSAAGYFNLGGWLLRFGVLDGNPMHRPVLGLLNCPRLWL